MTVKTNPDAEAAKPEPDDIVIDSKGRRIKVRQPSILDESRLMRLLGEASSNSAYVMGYCLPACMAVEIDGDPSTFPTTQLQLDAAIQRLGREGIAAVMDFIVKSTTPTDGGAAEAINKSRHASDVS